MAANIDGTLTGHVFTDFIHHLRSGQFPLTGIAAAGINQGFCTVAGYRGFVVQVSCAFSLTGGLPAG
jgi:hypothetical protein